MKRFKRCNVLFLLTLFGASFVVKVYGNGGIPLFDDTDDKGCIVSGSESPCCPSLLNEQGSVISENPGMADNSCACRCGGAVQSYTDVIQVNHDYCPAGEGYTASPRTRYTTVAGGGTGAEGASSSIAPEPYHSTYVLMSWIVISVIIFITL